MNKRILISLSVIGIVAAIAIGGTVAYFSDVETSEGNILAAGSIDLKIDLQCDSCAPIPMPINLNGQSFFNKCDVKPGDTGEATISWHLLGNNAWGRIKLADVVDYEFGCTDSETREAGDTTCGDINDPAGEGQGELSQHLKFTLWMDEGSLSGWQCGIDPRCAADPQEGDNIKNGNETILAEKTAEELLAGVILPGQLEGSKTYYLGMQWEVPSDGNDDIIQSDSLTGKIIMEVVQSKNNPNPWGI